MIIDNLSNYKFLRTEPMQIKLSQSIESTQQKIDSIMGIIYDKYHLPVIEDMVKQQILFEDQLIMLKSININRAKKHSNGENYFIAMQTNETKGASLQYSEQQSIRQVVGLCDQIVGIQLSPEIQTALEKIYLETVTEKYGHQQEQIFKNGSGNSSPKSTLNLVNSKYKKGYSRISEGIYYFKRVDDLIENSFLTHIIKPNYQRKLSQTEEDMSGTFKKEQVQKSDGSGISQMNLSVEEMLSIYNYCVLTQRQTYHIKYGVLRYKGVKELQQKIMQAEQEIVFSQCLQQRQIMKKIQNLHIPRQIQEKIEWKNRQIIKFNQILKEYHKNIELVRTYKTSPIYQLSNQIINMEISHFYRNWLASTFKKLKQSFYKIANRKDTKAVNQFRERCELTLKKITECEESKQVEEKNRVFLVKMREQIKDFIDYHEQIIKGTFFGSIKYMRKEVGYYWRNNPKIFHRIGLFILVAYLAYLQQNLIFSFTLLSVGLIFSSINI